MIVYIVLIMNMIMVQWIFYNDLFFFIIFQALGKFNREQHGFVDYLDFLTYVPLFIEIHGRIVSDPLSMKKDL